MRLLWHQWQHSCTTSGTLAIVDTSGGLVMLLTRRIVVALLASVGLLWSCVLPASAVATRGVPFSVDLTGEAEVNAGGVPNQGDLDGTGTATLRINPGLSQVCWTIEVAHVAPILAAHIHVGPATTTGPVVVPLMPYASGCTDVDRALALAIIRNPSAYYVNVHNADYRAGALRGQLDR